MNLNLHGIILAYHSSPALGELVRFRSGASLPFCGRYRLIDFPLSCMQGAGVRDIGVIMRHEYQSLLDHVGSGKDWDLSRKHGGLKLLPPFSKHDAESYGGVIEALCRVESYIRDIEQDYIMLARGDVVANVDIGAVMDMHLLSEADITAVCTNMPNEDMTERYIRDESGMVTEIQYGKSDTGNDVCAPIEMYIMSKSLVLSIIESSERLQRFRFHRDMMSRLLGRDGKVSVYMHNGYSKLISSTASYYSANMDVLGSEVRKSLFPKHMPVKTKGRADVSTYYGERAKVVNSLIADGCIIEGHVENSVVFRGARIGVGAVVKDSVIMQDDVIGEGVELRNVIADKDVEFSTYLTLAGSPRLPLIAPKGSRI